MPETDLKEAIEAAAMAAHQAVKAQEDLVSQAGDSKVQMPMQALPDPAALTRIAALRQQRIDEILRDDALGCSQRGHAMDSAKTETLEMLRSVGAVRSEASSVFPSTPSSLPTLHIYSSLWMLPLLVLYDPAHDGCCQSTIKSRMKGCSPASDLKSLSSG